MTFKSPEKYLEEIEDNTPDEAISRRLSREPRDLTGHPGHAKLRAFYREQERTKPPQEEKPDVLGNLFKSMRDLNAKRAAERKRKMLRETKALRAWERIQRGASPESAANSEAIPLSLVEKTLSEMGIEMTVEEQPQQLSIKEQQRRRTELRALQAWELHAGAEAMPIKAACKKVGISPSTMYAHLKAVDEREGTSREYKQKGRESSR